LNEKTCHDQDLFRTITILLKPHASRLFSVVTNPPNPVNYGQFRPIPLRLSPPERRSTARKKFSKT